MSKEFDKKSGVKDWGIADLFMCAVLASAGGCMALSPLPIADEESTLIINVDNQGVALDVRLNKNLQKPFKGETTLESLSEYMARLAGAGFFTVYSFGAACSLSNVRRSRSMQLQP